MQVEECVFQGFLLGLWNASFQWYPLLWMQKAKLCAFSNLASLYLLFLILEMTVSEHKGGQSLLKAGWTLRPPPHQALRPVGVLLEINADLQWEIEHSLGWTVVLSAASSRNWILSHNPDTHSFIFLNHIWLIRFSSFPHCGFYSCFFFFLDRRENRVILPTSPYN